MDSALSPLPATLCLIIAFLSVSLAWVVVEYQNLDTQYKVALIRMEGKIKELESKADDIIFKLDEHARKTTDTLSPQIP